MSRAHFYIKNTPLKLLFWQLFHALRYEAEQAKKYEKHFLFVPGEARVQASQGLFFLSTPQVSEDTLATSEISWESTHVHLKWDLNGCPKSPQTCPKSPHAIDNFGQPFKLYVSAHFGTKIFFMSLIITVWHLSTCSRSLNVFEWYLSELQWKEC